MLHWLSLLVLLHVLVASSGSRSEGVARGAVEGLDALPLGRCCGLAGVADATRAVVGRPAGRESVSR